MTVTIVRKAIKNMYLRIKPPNAQIVISAPVSYTHLMLPTKA